MKCLLGCYLKLQPKRCTAQTCTSALASISVCHVTEKNQFQLEDKAAPQASCTTINDCQYCFIASVDGLEKRRYILQGVTSHAGPTMKAEAVTSLLQALLNHEIFNHVSTKCHYRSNNVHIIYHLAWDLSASLFILSNLGWKTFLLLYRR